MTDIKQTETLINEVSKIVEKYKNIANETGENFNIFSIMTMEYAEVKTHSAIITELLNPRGSHGKGKAFLELFLEELKEEIQENNLLQNFNLNNVTVLKEEYNGRINQDYTSGGYIDIVIKEHKNVIVIENKIDAGDQFKQLFRYKKHYPNSLLLYLTLYGHKPSQDSIDDLIENVDYYCVSYQKLIKNWLERILNEIEMPLLIQQTIKQYYICVCNITNQNTSVKMNNEIKQLFNEDNIESIQELSMNLNEMISFSNEKFQNKLRQLLTTKIYLDNDLYLEPNFHTDVDGFFITIKLFLKNEENNLHESNQKVINELSKKFDKVFYNNSNHFVWYNPKPFQRHQAFQNLDIKTIYKLYSVEEYLKNFVEDIAVELNEVLELIKLEVLKCHKNKL
jgi:hypothetical protein